MRKRCNRFELEAMSRAWHATVVSKLVQAAVVGRKDGETRAIVTSRNALDGCYEGRITDMNARPKRAYKVGEATSAGRKGVP